MRERVILKRKVVSNRTHVHENLGRKEERKRKKRNGDRYIPESDAPNFSDDFCQDIEADSFSGRERRLREAELTQLPVERATVPGKKLHLSSRLGFNG